MNLVVEIIAAFATVAVAILAVWGDFFRNWLAGPKLRVSLLSPEGELTQFTSGQPVRYYHLTVSNLRRWAPAHQVRVVLTGITRFAAGAAAPSQPLSGALQLQWRFPQHQPQFQTVGPDHVSDLGSITQGQPFRFATYISPNNLDAELRAGDRMLIDVAAVADNAESPVLTLELAWNGSWDPDGAVMARHLVLRESNDGLTNGCS